MSSDSTPRVDPQYGTGDTVGWYATRRHGAGNGIITEVLPGAPGERPHYVVMPLIAGRLTHDPVTLEEDVIFRTLSFRDSRPLGYVPPRVHPRRTR